jgi:hypothetical protein
MYADNKSSDHNTWCKNIDDRRAGRNPEKSSNETPTPATPAPAQKLALND